MKEITVKIPEEHLEFFNELIDQLPFVERVNDTPPKKKKSEKEKVLQDIERGFKELQLVHQGKRSSRSAKEFANEL
jgi:hypothetical protein